MTFTDNFDPSAEAWERLLTMLEQAAGRVLRDETVSASDGEEISLEDCLSWELMNAVHRYKRCKNTTALTPKERNTYFNKLSNVLKSCQDLINNFPDDYFCHDVFWQACADSGTPHSLRRKISIDKFEGNFVLDDLSSLLKIVDHAESLSTRLKNSEMMGRPKDYAKRVLVCSLAYLWETWTGQKATFTTDPYANNARCGPFIDFVSAVLKASHIELEITDLGETIKNYLGERKDHQLKMDIDSDDIEKIRRMMVARKTGVVKR